MNECICHSFAGNYFDYVGNCVDYLVALEKVRKNRGMAFTSGNIDKLLFSR